MSSTPGASRPAVRVLATIFACGLGFVLFLVIGEFATRIINRDAHLYDVEMFKYSRALKQRAPAEAAEMHHWHVPGKSAVLQNVEIAINSRGLREREIPYERTPGVTRILALGDSITLGWGVDASKTYPKALENKLGAMGRGKFEVLNCGVGNYTITRIVSLYEHELHKYAPDIVSFAVFINDVNDVPDSPLQRVFDTPLQFPVMLWSMAQTAAASRGMTADFDAYYRNAYSDSNPAFVKCRKRLGEFLRRLKGEGRQVVLVSIPDVLHLAEPTYPYQYVTDHFSAIAREADVPFVDSYPKLKGMQPGEIMNSRTDRHPNAVGHQRIADAIVEKLTELRFR